MSKFDVVVAGSICLDMTPEFKKLKETTMGEIFVPGKNKNMNKMHISTGGPTSNSGIGLMKLGIPTRLMAKTGDDMLGDGVRNLISNYGISEGIMCIKGEETSYTVIIAPEGFDRIFLHSNGANDTFDSSDIDYDIVKEAKIFHMGYPTTMKRMYENGGEELVKIYKKIKEMGITTSLDMSLPDQNAPNGQMDWDSVLQKLLPYVDIYLPSAEETLFMLDKNEYNKLANSKEVKDVLDGLDINVLSAMGKKLISYGGTIVALKSGVKGFYMTTGDEKKINNMGKAKPKNVSDWANRELHEESFAVPVKAATGSGDSSIAGFLSAYLRDYPIEDCIKIACCTGGQNVQVFDAISGIHTFEETLELIHKWDKNKLEISGDYFKYLSDKKVFVGKGDMLYG